MKSKPALYKGILLILISATLSCTGQLFWKLAARDNAFFFVLFGLALYGCGALLMIIAMRYGELSVLHPMMGAGYVMSLLLGVTILGEDLSVSKLAGIGIIILGLVFLSLSDGGKTE